MSGLLGSALGAQLVKAGLATEDQLEKSKQSKKDQKKPVHNKNAKAKGKPNNKRRGPKPTTKPATNKGDTSKVEVSHNIVTRQVSKKSKVNDLIRKHVTVDAAADQEFNFAINGKLRQITVTQQQAEQISKGELAIVKTDVSRDPYALVPAAAAIEIRELQAGRIAAFFDDEESAEDEWPNESTSCDNLTPDKAATTGD